MKGILGIAAGGFLLFSGMALPGVVAAPTQHPQKNQEERNLQKPGDNDQHTRMLMIDEIRHQLVTLPYYGVFDWLEGRVMPDGTVVLNGEVVREATKSDAGKRVKSIEGVTKVVNNIEVLPASTMDDQIRRQSYRAIYNFDSPLFQYAIRAVPPIHIIVDHGHVTLKGIVLNAMDKQLAENYARQVPNTFDVKNELAVENNAK
jgi:hyperosmotically inducible protein